MDEQKNEIEKKPNIVEIAKKKRHLYLYEKLHSGTPLTPAELKELEKFEEVDSATGVVDTKEKVAKALKVSVRTVYYGIRMACLRRRKATTIFWISKHGV
jgi:hypothetical protein